MPHFTVPDTVQVVKIRIWENCQYILESL